MLDTYLYAVTDEHILYRVRVVKHKSMKNITRISTSIDLEDESDFPSCILDHHLEHVMSFTFRNNVNEQYGVFDNKKDALEYVISEIDGELKVIEEQQKILSELKAKYTC